MTDNQIDEQNWPDFVDDAFKRMKRAYDRETGCHLTREMILALSVTVIGEYWQEKAGDE